MRERIFMQFAIVLSVLLAGCASTTSSFEGPDDTSPVPGYSIRAMAGFRVYVANEIKNDHPGMETEALKALKDDLNRIVESIPERATAALRRTSIFVENESQARPVGFTGRGAVYHPSAEWLKANGFIPEKVRSVEISNIRDYLSWRKHQPSMVLHELAHAYYWLVGPDLPEVKAAYESAVASGIYEKVRYVLSENDDDLRGAYALSYVQEYFAELSEAYFGRNDFYPFVREELKVHDPKGLRAIEEVWGLRSVDHPRRAFPSPGSRN